MRGQTHPGMDRTPRLSALRLATLVCLVLLALLAVIQVMHVHPIGTDADQCPLCIAMHSVVPLVVMVAELLLFRIGTVAPASLAVCAKQQYWYPTLFTRPPPAR